MHDKLSALLLAQRPVLLSVGKRDLSVRTDDTRTGWQSVFTHLLNLAEKHDVLPEACLRALGPVYELAVLVAFSHRMAGNLADLGMGPVAVTFSDGSAHVLAEQRVDAATGVEAPATVPQRPADWVVQRIVGCESRYVLDGFMLVSEVADAKGFTRRASVREARERCERHNSNQFFARERRFRADGFPYLVEETSARAVALTALDGIDTGSLAALRNIVVNGSDLA